MSILDKAELRPTGDRRAVLCRFTLEPKKDIIPYEVADGYRLRLLIGTDFYCRKEVYPYALANAKEAMLHFLYRDALDILHQLKGAVYAGDEEEVMKQLSALEKEFTKC